MAKDLANKAKRVPDSWLLIACVVATLVAAAVFATPRSADSQIPTNAVDEPTIQSTEVSEPSTGHVDVAEFGFYVYDDESLGHNVLTWGAVITNSNEELDAAFTVDVTGFDADGNTVERTAAEGTYEERGLRPHGSPYGAMFHVAAGGETGVGYNVLPVSSDLHTIEVSIGKVSWHERDHDFNPRLRLPVQELHATSVELSLTEGAAEESLLRLDIESAYETAVTYPVATLIYRGADGGIVGASVLDINAVPPGASSTGDVVVHSHPPLWSIAPDATDVYLSWAESH